MNARIDTDNIQTPLTFFEKNATSAAGRSVRVYAPPATRMNSGCGCWKENKYIGATATSTKAPNAIAQITVTRLVAACIQSRPFEIKHYSIGPTARDLSSGIAQVLIARLKSFALPVKFIHRIEVIVPLESVLCVTLIMGLTGSVKRSCRIPSSTGTAIVRSK